MTDFYKYHALGNDYIVIDPNNTSIDTPLTPASIKSLCSRHHGIGSDGILYGPTIDKKNNNLHMQIFNPDGSEAEKSGNGIRIFAQYLYDSKYVHTKTFSLHTKGGIVLCEQVDPQKCIIKVNMGDFTFTERNTEQEIINYPVSVNHKNLLITHVDIGNPHCVIFDNSITPKTTKIIGPHIEKLNLFPNRTNVQFVKIIDRSNIQIEIWERGAGYTLSSGSSSCAAAAASHKLGMTNSTINVITQGGPLKVDIHNNQTFLEGPVTRIMSGKLLPHQI